MPPRTSFTNISWDSCTAPHLLAPIFIQPPTTVSTQGLVHDVLADIIRQRQHPVDPPSSSSAPSPLPSSVSRLVSRTHNLTRVSPTLLLLERDPHPITMEALACKLPQRAHPPLSRLLRPLSPTCVSLTPAPRSFDEGDFLCGGQDARRRQGRSRMEAVERGRRGATGDETRPVRVPALVN